jgi:hypothetical protein
MVVVMSYFTGQLDTVAFLAQTTCSLLFISFPKYAHIISVIIHAAGCQITSHYFRLKTSSLLSYQFSFYNMIYAKHVFFVYSVLVIYCVHVPKQRIEFHKCILCI